MSSVIQDLTKKQLIRPPSHVEKGIQYEVYMGSIAYGVSNNMSDIDIYGFSIPSKNLIFPHLQGIIPGFGKQIKRFEQYQQHHIKSLDGKKEYDLTIYNIIKFFQLCMDNNPNMIDSLFVPERCISFMTPVGSIVRNNRRLFLHKGAYHKYRGYAYSQLHKCRIKTNLTGKRKELVEKYGFNTKFAYHIPRLLLQIEQIMIEGDLDLERNREYLKAVRRGEVPLKDIEKWKTEKELSLEKLYNDSKLPYKPDESMIKRLLLNCLEEYYGKLSNIEYTEPNKINELINDLTNLINKYQ